MQQALTRVRQRVPGCMLKTDLDDLADDIGMVALTSEAGRICTGWIGLVYCLARL